MSTDIYLRMLPNLVNTKVCQDIYDESLPLPKTSPEFLASWQIEDLGFSQRFVYFGQASIKANNTPEYRKIHLQNLEFLSLAILQIEMTTLKMLPSLFDFSREELWKAFVQASYDQRVFLNEFSWKKIDEEVSQEELKVLILLLMFSRIDESELGKKLRLQVLEESESLAMLMNYLKNYRQRCPDLHDLSEVLEHMVSKVKNI